MTQTADSQSSTVLLATFYVRDALCALDAAGIQEVIRVGQVTPVRHAPEEIIGIANLRGKIVTILDLGLKLGFPNAIPTADSRLCIIEDRGEFIGLLVDRVDEVIEMDTNHCEPPPANIPSAQVGYFRGVCRSGRRVISLIDVQQVLTPTGP